MPVPAAPAAPSCLKETTISSTITKLSWLDNATTEDGFEIWYKETNSTLWKYYSTVGPNKTNVDFIYPEAGKTCQFKVRAYNFSQWSDYNKPCSEK
jgi:hypothetical protein